jgi:hypothetical protein
MQLVDDAPPPSEPNATLHYPPPRDTGPPPTEIFRTDATLVSQPPPVTPQWSPLPPAQAPRKSNAVWWILGGVAVIAIVGVGLVVILIAIAAMSSSSNANRSNTNTNANRSNANNANSSRANTNTSPGMPSSFSDDFSKPKWATGNSQFGDLWYADDAYHMRSKEKTYIVRYAPNNDYSTENATVRVTVRNVDGVSPTSGYGLVVHGVKKDDKAEDYAFLISTGENPQYRVVMHKEGKETELVPSTGSSIIRSGTSPNQLEVRIKGSQLGFYVNSQYVTRITDSAGFKRGVAGFYTSDAHEVVFDDLEIIR